MNKKTKPKVSKIEKTVMDRIKKGEVKIKPQSYYLIIGSLSVLSVVFLSVITAFLLSIVMLWLRVQISQGPAFGARITLANLFGSFPWLALSVGTISLIVLLITVKKTGHLYKVRLAYLVPLIVAMFMAIGFILSFTMLPNAFDGPKRNNRCIESGANCRPASIRYFNYK